MSRNQELTTKGMIKRLDKAEAKPPAKSAGQRKADRIYAQWQKKVDREKAYEQNLRGPQRWPDQGKYFPHQGARECARRVRQGAGR